MTDVSYQVRHVTTVRRLSCCCCWDWGRSTGWLGDSSRGRRRTGSRATTWTSGVLIETAVTCCHTAAVRPRVATLLAADATPPRSSDCGTNWFLHAGVKLDELELRLLVGGEKSWCYSGFYSRQLLHSFYARQHAVARTCHRPSVCPSVCLSHEWISRKRLKLGSCNFHHTVATSL